MNSYKGIAILLRIVFASLVLANAAAAAGELDTTFSGGVYGTGGGSVNVIKLLPDGKMLIGGTFTVVQGYAATSLARLNADGTVDTSFNGPAFNGSFGLGGPIYAIEVQPDGKILVGGGIYGVGQGNNISGIRRLNPDGSIDPTFALTDLEGNEDIRDIILLPDGKILIAGAFRIVGVPFPAHRSMARLNPDGTHDTSYTASPGGRIYDMELLPDGKVVAVGGSVSESTPLIAKFDATGAIDQTFTQWNTGDGYLEAVKLLPSGKLIIAGDYSQLGTTSQSNISRLNSNGTIDTSFNQNMPGPDGTVQAIALRPDGKIFIGGRFSNYNGVPIKRIARLNEADGSLDNTFVNTDAFTNTYINDLVLLSDNRILAGLFSPTSSVLRFGPDGGIDTSLDVRATGPGIVRKILQQPDGKILAAGTFPAANGVERRSLARFNPDGTLDTSFVPYFTATAPATVVNSIGLQPDGKVLVGTNNGIVLVRLNLDGSRDTSFNTVLDGSSNIWDIEVLPDGKILISGNVNIPPTTSRVARLHTDGSIDNTFSPAPINNLVYEIAIQPDGKLLVGGEFTMAGGLTRGGITRLNADGSHDPSFVLSGGASGSVVDIGLQADGKIVVGGWYGSLNGNTSVKNIGRLNSDGSLDLSFNPTANGAVNGIKIQPDGRILMVGQFFVVNGLIRNAITRLNSNGSVDSTFTPSSNTAVYDVQLQSDGKILIGGQFTRINGLSSIAIARLLNASAPTSTLFDYDGDGRSDVSVFRPSENRWYIFRSSDSSITQTVFAIPGDIPVPADYDGDEKTDIAIYRPSSGAWWYLSSINGAQITAQWGGVAGDVPRPSDFDGDGKADFIVFRPSNNFWYRISGATGVASNIAFGLAGDKPVTGDFDGDGKSDPAIFRPSTGDWWYLSSLSGAQLAVRWGISTDVPAPADFDGDGRTDFAVYRPSTGVWYIINSSSGSFTIMAFGLSQDKPVPADYDGDGKADIAVFRPSTGVWYLMRSTAGFAAMQFGVSTDIPTPNAFVP